MSSDEDENEKKEREKEKRREEREREKRQGMFNYFNRYFKNKEKNFQIKNKSFSNHVDQWMLFSEE